MTGMSMLRFLEEKLMPTRVTGRLPPFQRRREDVARRASTPTSAGILGARASLPAVWYVRGLEARAPRWASLPAEMGGGGRGAAAPQSRNDCF